MSKTNYARTVEEARAFRQAVNSYLLCPACGECCLSVSRSMTAVVMRCEHCCLRFHCRRSDLADSIRTRADQSTGEDRTKFMRLAALLAPPGGESYEAWRRHNQWKDPTLR